MGWVGPKLRCAIGLLDRLVANGLGRKRISFLKAGQKVTISFLLVLFPFFAKVLRITTTIHDALDRLLLYFPEVYLVVCGPDNSLMYAVSPLTAVFWSLHQSAGAGSIV